MLSWVSSRADFRVLRYDHPGHGRSENPPGPSRSRRSPEASLELLDRLELERVSFCGLSLGGMVGMELALEAPERVDRLVLCCTAAHLGRRRVGTSGRGSSARGNRCDRGACARAWFTQRFRDEQPDA